MLLSFIKSITWALYIGVKLSNILEPAVVLKSLVTILSFIAIGIPNNILSTSFSSSSFALTSASSLFKVINALRSLFSILSNDSFTKSSTFIFFSFNNLLISIIDRSKYLVIYNTSYFNKTVEFRRCILKYFFFR